MQEWILGQPSEWRVGRNRVHVTIQQKPKHVIYLGEVPTCHASDVDKFSLFIYPYKAPLSLILFFFNVAKLSLSPTCFKKKKRYFILAWTHWDYSNQPFLYYHQPCLVNCLPQPMSAPTLILPQHNLWVCLLLKLRLINPLSHPLATSESWALPLLILVMILEMKTGLTFWMRPPTMNVSLFISL